jgi:hypothetical protein
MEARAKQNLDAESGQALLGEGGLLQSGLAVALPGMTEEGQSAFLDVVSGVKTAAPADGKKAKGRKPAADKNDESVHADPAAEAPVDTVATMRSLLSDVHKEAGEAKAFAIQLAGKELSSDLQKQMNSHSKFCYAMARKIDELLTTGETDIDVYRPYLVKLDTAQTWYASRSKSAKGLLRPFQAKAKAKAKAAANE